MYQLDGTPGRTCIIEGKEYLFFSGYSYLGMNHLAAFSNLVKEGIDKYGVLFPSSRISNTRLALYQQFEEALSDLTRMDETVSFSSGFLAGQSIAAILSNYKTILAAPGTHPAIHAGEHQITGIGSFKEWTQYVITVINSTGEDDIVLLADSVNILQAEVNDFEFLQETASSKKIIFLIDDSHGIGILGTNGEGIVSQLPQKENIDYLLSYSLSKAFGIEGGCVSCNERWATKLRHHPSYTGSTAINPSLAYAFLQSRELYASQRNQLMKNIRLFKETRAANFASHDFEIPVFICNSDVTEDQFFKKGIIISSFGYPHPSSPKINRVVLNALHTKNDMLEICGV